jgi:phage terminase small subunit
MNRLNPKQEKFCQEYYKTSNATQSYISAGYSEKGAEVSASQLLRNPKVIARLDELKKDAQKEFKIDRKFLFDGYMELIEKHKDLTPAVAKGSYDSIAKMFGLNEADKIELSGKIEGFKIVLDEGN